MRKTYTICITETLQKVVRVEADSSEDALQGVRDKYWDGDIVLTEHDFVDVSFEETLDEYYTEIPPKFHQNTDFNILFF
jgi:hypothetical protein